MMIWMHNTFSVNYEPQKERYRMAADTAEGTVESSTCARPGTRASSLHTALPAPSAGASSRSTATCQHLGAALGERHFWLSTSVSPPSFRLHVEPLWYKRFVRRNVTAIGGFWKRALICRFSIHQRDRTRYDGQILPLEIPVLQQPGCALIISFNSARNHWFLPSAVTVILQANCEGLFGYSYSKS